MIPATGTLIDGKYCLEELLAEGGMGAVWIAHHQKLDARVAVKFMAPELAQNEILRARFEREAKAAARLRSPHVVQVLDYGLDGEMPYIVMELLQGEDLRARLKRRGMLTLREASIILTDACKALALASKAGIIHRDLKPANIFLAKSGEDEVAKILDFGVAKATRNELGEGTTSGMLLGSPHYMSPEQSRGLELDHRSDLFSLAVILFQMLTGKKPFRGNDVGDVIVKICTAPLPLPTQLVASLPAEVDAFFERAMAREPTERFQSASEMAVAFTTIVANHVGEPVPSNSGGFSMPPQEAAPHAEPLFEEAPTLVSPSTPKPGTLTLATRSVETGMPTERSSRWGMVVVAAVAVIGVLAFLALSGDRNDNAGQPAAAPLRTRRIGVRAPPPRARAARATGP